MSIAMFRCFLNTIDNMQSGLVDTLITDDIMEKLVNDPRWGPTKLQVNELTNEDKLQLRIYKYVLNTI